MRSYQTRRVVDEVKINHYREEIVRIKKPRTYRDRVMLYIYQQIVEEYDKQQQTLENL